MTSEALGMTDEAPGARASLRELLDWAVGQSSLNMGLVDTQMRQLRINPAMCRMLGLDSEAPALDLRLSDLVSTPDSESCVAYARAVARTGEPALWTGLGPAVDGSLHAWECTLSPVKDRAGLVRGVLAIGRDVSTRHTRTGTTIWALQPLPGGR